MKVLLITPRFPFPPERGDTVRSCAWLQGLAAAHDVWLACVDVVEPQPAALRAVQQMCRGVAVHVASSRRRLWRGLLALLSHDSLTAGYFNDAGLCDTLRTWSDDIGFDAVLTYSSAMAPAANWVRAPQRVVDLCDVDSAKWQAYAAQRRTPLRWVYGLESRRVRALEATAVAGHQRCIVVNAREQAKLHRLLPHAQADVVPTVVDLAEYADFATPTVSAEPIIGFAGALFYPPNVRAVQWFGRYVWPRVRAQCPTAQWWLIGQGPTRSVRQWARMPGVTVTGRVADVRPYLKRLRVVVNPVTAELGVQSKLVVALAAGRPAVVTPQAAAGLVYADPPPFVVAAGPEAFAAAVVRVLRDDTHAAALAQRARQTAEEQYGAATVAHYLAGWLAADTADVPAPRRQPGRPPEVVAAGSQAGIPYA